MCREQAARSTELHRATVGSNDSAALTHTVQVEGRDGLKKLTAKISTNGPGVLYHGALASAAATFVGHYPWFTTYNYLNARIPKPEELHLRLLRSAFIGFCAGVVADTVSNGVRVVKTTRQTVATTMSYAQVIKVSMAM